MVIISVEAGREWLFSDLLFQAQECIHPDGSIEHNFCGSKIIL